MAGTPSEVSDLQAQPSGPQIRPSAVTAYVTRPSEAFKADKDLEPQIEAQEREVGTCRVEDVRFQQNWAGAAAAATGFHGQN